VKQTKLGEFSRWRPGWRSVLVSVTSLLAWVLANGLDVLSVLVFLQNGGQMVFARYHPAEGFLIYAGLRALGTMALPLAVVSAGTRWPSASRAAWGAMTMCALGTAVAAWWRLYW
jgi:hypothetical protein